MADESSIQPPAGAQPLTPQPQRIVVVPTKSVGLAIFLGVFFGPVGLLYSTVLGAIVMFVVNILVGLFTLGFGLFITWPICGIWAYVAAKAYNEKLLAGQRQY
jgi:H+/Cl- antiporter ClcA